MSHAPSPYGSSNRPRPAFGRAGAKLVTPQRARALEPATSPRPQRPEVFHADGAFNVGRVFARALGVLRSDLITFIALVALFAVPERIAYHLGTGKLGASIGTLALLLSAVALKLAVIHLALRRFAGMPADFGACIVKALKAFFPALLIGLVSGLAIGGAMILLIVPGIMVTLAWSLALPAYLGEDVSLFSSFGRSSGLTRGHRWKILAVLLLSGLILGALAAILMPIWGIHDMIGVVVFLSGNWLIRLISSGVFALILAAMYQELAGTNPADAFD